MARLLQVDFDGVVCVVLDRCERLFSPYKCGAQPSDDAGAAAIQQLLAATRLCGTADVKVVFVGDDRRLAPHATRLRDPLRVDFPPYDADQIADVCARAGHGGFL